MTPGELDDFGRRSEPESFDPAASESPALDLFGRFKRWDSPKEVEAAVQPSRAKNRLKKALGTLAAAAAIATIVVPAFVYVASKNEEMDEAQPYLKTDGCFISTAAESRVALNGRGTLGLAAEYTAGVDGQGPAAFCLDEVAGVISKINDLDPTNPRAVKPGQEYEVPKAASRTLPGLLALLEHR